jgi:hypothetical protein
MAAVATLAVIPAAATVINFDDIDASGGFVILDTLSPYQGFDWTNFSVYTNYYGLPGYDNGIVSSPNAASTSGDSLGSPIISTISSTASFDFVSAYLGSGWYDGLNVTVEGFDGATMDFSKTVTVNTEGAQLFTFNFDGIDELKIFSTVTTSTTDPYFCGVSGCSQVTLDDLTFTPASGPPPPVPEPSMTGIAGLGILALAAFRHARARRS